MRQGFLLERDVMTRIGKVRAQVSLVRDRGISEDGSKFQHSSSLVLLYLHRAKSVEELCNVFTLKEFIRGTSATP